MRIGGTSNKSILNLFKKTIEDYRIIKKNSSIFKSSNDNGIYDAINKGVNLASGDIIGILHSDDVYENESVISQVIEVFKKTNSDLVYGDLVYVTKNKNLNIRYWQAGLFLDDNIKKGWMPPHPTVFVKKKYLKK